MTPRRDPSPEPIGDFPSGKFPTNRTEAPISSRIRTGSAAPADPGSTPSMAASSGITRSSTLTSHFSWKSMTCACHEARRYVDEIWQSGIDLSKGNGSDFPTESNVDTLNSNVRELLGALHFLEHCIEELSHSQHDQGNSRQRVADRERAA